MIFTCYARADLDPVSKFVGEMQNESVQLWYDQQKIGDVRRPSLLDEIYNAINKSTGSLIFFSSEFTKRTHGAVKIKELGRIRQRIERDKSYRVAIVFLDHYSGKQIIPELDLMYLVRTGRLATFDFTEWRKQTTLLKGQSEFRRLISLLKAG